MGDSDSGYQFGTRIDDEELARLEAQGAALAPATRMIFTEAGIQQLARPAKMSSAALSPEGPEPHVAMVESIRQAAGALAASQEEYAHNARG